MILTKAWQPPLQCRQWSVHCLGDTNTCGNRNGLGNTYTEGSSTPICGWKTIFLVRCRGGSLLGLRWCQRIQLLIIDLACSQQNGADHPKESKRRNWERARYTIHTVCHDAMDGRQAISYNFKHFPKKESSCRIVHAGYNELCPCSRLLVTIPHHVWAVTLPSAPS